jgi:hypothetical protein
MAKKEAIENITASHPRIKTHAYYDAKAKFPQDLSPLLPPDGVRRWWERIRVRTVPVNFQFVALASGPTNLDVDIEMADGAKERAPQAAIANEHPKVSRICFTFLIFPTLFKTSSKAVCKGCQLGRGGDIFIARRAERGEQIVVFARFVLI